MGTALSIPPHAGLQPGPQNLLGTCDPVYRSDGTAGHCIHRRRDLGDDTDQDDDHPGGLLAEVRVEVLSGGYQASETVLTDGFGMRSNRVTID